MTTPLVTKPTARPRSDGTASVAVKATKTCTTTASSPTAIIPPNRMPAWCAVLTTIRAIADNEVCAMISLR
jgi:hypothetical protein